MGLKSSAKVGLIKWFNDLTFREVHSYVIGIGLMYLYLQTYNPYVMYLMLGLLGVEGVEKVLKKYVYEQVQLELWYYLGGIVSAPILDMIHKVVLAVVV